MNNDVTLLVNSYDGGSDTWDGFFTCLLNEWAEFDLPIVLNTESKSYSFPGLNIRTLSLYKQRNVPWGKRLIETLNRIETKNILFILDDFWLDSRVDDSFFRQCIQWLNASEDVSYFSFQRVIDHENVDDKRFERFEKRSKNGPYRMNCQVALWKKDELIKCIRPHESPWEWERYGSIRSRRYDKSLYSKIETATPVFSYDRGGVIYRGKWNLEVVEPLCKKNGIKLDYSKRGVFDGFQPYHFSFKKAIRNRIQYIRSII